MSEIVPSAPLSRSNLIPQTPLIRGTLAALAFLCSLGTTVNAQAPVPTLSIYQGNSVTIATGNGSIQSGAGANMEIPRAFSFDTFDASGNQFKKIFVSWNNDCLAQSYYHKVSTDSGATWGATVTTAPVPLEFGHALKRRSDGTLIALNIQQFTSGGPALTFTNNYYTSTNNGANWTTQTNGSFTFPEQVYWVFVHRGMFEENGKLYVAGYALYVADFALGNGTRSVLFESTDGGVNWVQTAKVTPATGGAEERADPGFGGSIAYSEWTIARCADGSWLGVIREGHKWQYPFKYTRSTDKGVTWSTLAYLPGLGSLNGGFEAWTSDEQNETADPNLKLMPNGVMVLSYGRPNTKLAFSADGSGANWGYKTRTYTEDWATGGQRSYCYTSIAQISPQEFLNFGDTGAEWSYGTPYPNPSRFSIWQKKIEIVRDQVNRIDLKTKLKLNPAMVMTDMTYANIAAFPETRVAGAVDGSTDYWSGAFKNATSGSYQIDLQANHTLNALGICLQTSVAQAATVQFSTNGSSWTTMYNFPNTTKHYAMQYFNFAPVQARYVKVSVSSTTAPVSLNEIELYETASTFENEALGGMPVGYVRSPDYGFWVTDSEAPLPSGYESKRALLMYDGTTSAQVTCTRTTTATATKTMEFRYRPQVFATGGAHQFLLRSSTTTSFQIAVFPDLSIKYYAATPTAGWVQIAPANTISPLNSWTLIRIEANATAGTAGVYVNNVLKGTAIKINSSIPSTINNFLLASGGTAPTGDLAMFDDISF